MLRTFFSTILCLASPTKPYFSVFQESRDERGCSIVLLSGCENGYAADVFLKEPDVIVDGMP